MYMYIYIYVSINIFIYSSNLFIYICKAISWEYQGLLVQGISHEPIVWARSFFRGV